MATETSNQFPSTSNPAGSYAAATPGSAYGTPQGVPLNPSGMEMSPRSKNNVDLAQLLTWAGVGLIGLGVVVAVVLLLKGGLGPSNVRTFTLGPGRSYQMNVNFKKDARAVINVTSEQDSDVDIFVYDARGALVVKDEYDDKNCSVSFTPRETQRFKIVVVNRIRLDSHQQHRNRDNRCTLKYEPK
jgi:hypothetical protein